MKYKFVDRVYDTLIGMLNGIHAVSGVEDAFKLGSYCMNLYEEVYQANLNLCVRLGSGDCDDDVETIISCMSSIQRELCYQMFYLGIKFSSHPNANDME